MSSNQFSFTPEERGFENVKDDDSDALYATDESRDATGRVASERFAARGSEQTGFYAQKVQRDESGKIVGKQTFGTKKDSREEAVESIEKQVRNRTAAGFGGFQIGEFTVGDDSDIALARRAHLARPEEAQASDAAKRAPVTTDASRYASQPGELDYPGVDTPSTDPKVLPKDLRQKQRPGTTEPKNRQNQNLAANPTEDIALRDEAEAGLSRDDVRRTVESPADVGVSLDERRGSMVSDTGLGGVLFNRDEGFRETDRPERDETPPDIARGEDPFDISTGGGPLDGGAEESERDAVTEDNNRSLVTEYGGIPPQNPTTELPGVGETTADKLENEAGVSSVEEFYKNREQAESVLSKQFREEARTVAAYSVGAVDNPAGGREADPAFTEAESERGDDGSTFSPDRDEREAIRKLERNSPGREAEQIEKVRLFDDPPEEALETFGEAADRLLSNRDEIMDSDRADTSFFESDTIDTIDRLRTEVR